MTDQAIGDEPAVAMPAEPAASRPSGKDGGFRRVRSFLARGPGAFQWFEASLAVAYLALLMFVVAVVRVLTLEPIEVGGDAVTVWEFARHLHFGGDFPETLNHHTARFGLVLPTRLMQALFGAGATTYFLGPLCASVVLHGVVYLTVKRLAGVISGTLAVLFLLAFEPMERAGSQILPETFGPMYVALSYYLALLYTDARGKWSRRFLLTLSAGAMFFAYGSKESYLYFAPGLALFVWKGDSVSPSSARPTLMEARKAPLPRRVYAFLQARSLVVPGILALLVVGFIVLESIFLSSTTASSNRFSLVSGSHGGLGSGGPRIRTFADFFALYTRAPDEWILVLAVGGMAVIGLLGFAEDKRVRLYAWALVIYVLLQTFVIRRLNPLTPWTEPHPRYLIAMAAPVAACVALFVGHALGRVFAPKAPLRGLRAVSELLGTYALAGALVYLVNHDLVDRWESTWNKSDALSRTKRWEKDLSDAFRAGLPLVSPTAQGKPAIAALAVYVDPELQMLDGKLVRPKELSVRLGAGRYTARILLGQKVSKKRIKAWVDYRDKAKECLVILTQRGRNMSVRILRGKSCEPLEDVVNTKPPKTATPKRRPKARRSTSPRAQKPSALPEDKQPQAPPSARPAP